MIPTTIQREHVLLAAEWIDRHGVGGRDSRKYLVVINGRTYPPKLVISKAYFYAHGSEWSHENFTGGEETNSFLRGLGFKIEERGFSHAVQVMTREIEPICEKCGHKNPTDFIFCEMCGHHARLTTSSDGLTPRRRSEWMQSPHESGVDEWSRTTRTVVSCPPVSSCLNRVRQIAKRLDVKNVIVQADVDRCGLNSFLIWQAGGQEIWISEGNEGAHDILHMNLAIRFNHEASVRLGSVPEKDHSEILSSIMRGGTKFKITFEKDALTTIILHQSISATEDDVVLTSRLATAIQEFMETDYNVWMAYLDAIERIIKEREKNSQNAPPNHMYA